MAKQSLNFHIDCIPPKSTAQAGLTILKNKTTGKFFVGKFATSKSQHTKNQLMELLSPHKPTIPLTSPLFIQILWAYPYRKSEKKRRIGNRIYCDTRPDIDNLCKLLFDCMTRLGFWLDDGQIADLRFIKVWDKQVGIWISIEELDSDGVKYD